MRLEDLGYVYDCENGYYAKNKYNCILAIMPNIENHKLNYTGKICLNDYYIHNKEEINNIERAFKILQLDLKTLYEKCDENACDKKSKTTRTIRKQDEEFDGYIFFTFD